MPRTMLLARSILLVGLTLLPLAGCDDVRGGATTASSGEGAIQASARAEGPGGFTGVFHSTLEGTRSVLNLTERHGKLNGMLDASNLTALVDGDRATGDVKDPATAAKLGTVQMSLSGDVLTLTLTATDPQNGATMQLPPLTYARGAPPPIDVQLDAQLAGRWRHRWAAAEGGAGAAADVWLVLNPDGSVEYGSSKAASETATDDGFGGRWRSSDQTLHVMPSGHAHWTPYARYQVEGAKLLLTFNDGSRQVYYRD